MLGAGVDKPKKKLYAASSINKKPAGRTMRVEKKKPAEAG